MEFLKKHLNWVIIILIIFCLGGCAKSCSKQRKINRLEKTIKEKDNQLQNKDSVISQLHNKNQVLVEKIYGYEKTLNIQSEAINQIVAAKKNITVSLKRK